MLVWRGGERDLVTGCGVHVVRCGGPCGWVWKVHVAGCGGPCGWVWGSMWLGVEVVQH